MPTGQAAKREDVRDKIAAAHRGKKANIAPDVLAARNLKIADANRRRKLGEESRRKMSQTQRAKGIGVRYVVNGVAMTVTEVAEAYRIPEGAFRKRIEGGWHPDRAATTPVRPVERKNARYVIDGLKPMTAQEVARRFGIAMDTFLKRIEAGWDAHRAATTPVRSYNKQQG